MLAISVPLVVFPLALIGLAIGENRPPMSIALIVSPFTIVVLSWWAYFSSVAIFPSINHVAFVEPGYMIELVIPQSSTFSGKFSSINSILLSFWVYSILLELLYLKSTSFSWTKILFKYFFAVDIGTKFFSLGKKLWVIDARENFLEWVCLDCDLHSAYADVVAELVEVLKLSLLALCQERHVSEAYADWCPNLATLVFVT